MRKWLCKLLGHDATETDWGTQKCQRCGEVRSYMHNDQPFALREESGLIRPLRDLWHRIVRRCWPRCHECGKLLLFRKRFDQDFCSKKCCDDWIPF